ncbi:putative solute-binding protein [Thalassolituus marinus]|uniref:Solute-binding protein family 3/N-terminal domain-containing protein n=1 Tax=Thalassolituus marinus TaxID=671053 RepID=A0ABS7ZWM8_9GAMM|nr:putative solute-binding protein [Thalassolituus marinus]MCA6064980.1 hypothetical protein [Thalassolituus marinus]
MKGILSLLLVSLTLLAPVTQAADDLSDRKKERRRATVMGQHLPLEKRIRALRQLYGDQLEGGKIVRSFCVWDMLGKSGPVYATVEDQTLRSLHYGLQLTVVPYQTESELINDLKNGTCDAALMSGSRALEFNRFAGTVEALGAVPDTNHLQTLIQVMASPKMADRLEGNGYVVMGVASLGENYLFARSEDISGPGSLSGKTIAVPQHDQSLQTLGKQLKAVVSGGEQLGIVQQFVSGQSDSMLAPLVAFYAAGAGQAGEEVKILNYPLSQSTIQLIGRQERFPTELAQMLREDFLFKFPQYVKRLEKERTNIRASLWRDMAQLDQSAFEQRMQKLRLYMRDRGDYDASMLKLARKVRCKTDPQRTECVNPVE